MPKGENHAEPYSIRLLARGIARSRRWLSQSTDQAATISGRRNDDIVILAAMKTLANASASSGLV